MPSSQQLFLQSSAQIAAAFKKDLERVLIEEFQGNEDKINKALDRVDENIDRYIQYFVAADQDESQDIDFDELKKALPKLGFNVPEEELELKVAIVDDDDNRTLRLREFLNFMFIVEGTIKRRVPETKVLKPPGRLAGRLGRRQGAMKQKKRGSLNLRVEIQEQSGEYVLSVKVMEGRNLLPMDFSGTSDPYVKLVLTPDVPHTKAKMKQKTERVMKTLNPKWNQSFCWLIPRTEDLSKYTLLVTVWDWDRWSANDFMGAMAFRLEALQTAHVTEGWFLLLDSKQGLLHNFKDLSAGAVAAPPPSAKLPAPDKDKKHSPDDYTLRKVLGVGGYGKVFLAENKKTHQFVALKCIKKVRLLEDDHDWKSIWTEHSVLSIAPQSPFIVHMSAAFQNPACLFFAMELLVGGDLMYIAMTHGALPVSSAAFYVAEIVCGLEFLHKHNIIHRDLKLDNVLLDQDGHVKLADFGLCKEHADTAKAESFCGTPSTMAPEVVKRVPYSYEVDWWSLGVVTYELVTSSTLFAGDSVDDIYENILEQDIHISSSLGQPTVDLLNGLLCREPKRRLGSGPAGSADIRKQKFFVHDWAAIERRAVPAPFPPKQKEPAKAAVNFDADFTTMEPTISPTFRSDLKKIDQSAFAGFSYVAPDAL